MINGKRSAAIMKDDASAPAVPKNGCANPHCVRGRLDHVGVTNTGAAAARHERTGTSRATDSNMRDTLRRRNPSGRVTLLPRQSPRRLHRTQQHPTRHILAAHLAVHRASGEAPPQIWRPVGWDSGPMKAQYHRARTARQQSNVEDRGRSVLSAYGWNLTADTDQRGSAVGTTAPNMVTPCGNKRAPATK